MAEFTEQIQAALPGKEIVHNAIWFADDDDPSVRRELDAATHVELERGVNDAGIRGGGGQWGYETFMKRIDRLHGRGKGVIFDSFAEAPATSSTRWPPTSSCPRATTASAAPGARPRATGGRATTCSSARRAAAATSGRACCGATSSAGTCW